MATWTDIPNASLEPGAPARSVDAIALRDNITALAEGATGAPPIVNAAHLAPVAGATYAIPLTGAGVSYGTTNTGYAARGTRDANPNEGIALVCLVAGSIRCTFSHYSVGDTAYARILKNGVLVQEWTTTSGTPVARSVDVSVAVNDIITFQQRTSNANFSATWKDLYVKSATANFFIA